MNASRPLTQLTRVIALLGLIASNADTFADASTNDTAPDRILLQDYRPRVIHHVPRTTITQARFPVIDVHSHPYPKTAEQLEQWVRTMDDVGIEKTVIMTGATGKRFDELLAQYQPHRDRFSVWCGFDYTGFDQPGYGPAAVAELERCVRAGAEGVGELSDKGGGLLRKTDGSNSNLHFDDPRLDSLIEKCAAVGVPINIHIGEPQWMYEPMDRFNDGLMNAYTWRLDNKPNILSHAEVLATLERALKKHPHNTIIACHFANCCFDLSLLGRLFDTHPNLYADIAARYAETAPIPRYMARFYDQYQDRLLYGTDMGYSKTMYPTTFRILETEDEQFHDWNLFSYHWSLYGFGLNNGILRKVYADNARKILRPSRR
jgi:predicted TIM-barrel fold metal-dependent hydrolase